MKLSESGESITQLHTQRLCLLQIISTELCSETQISEVRWVFQGNITRVEASLSSLANSSLSSSRYMNTYAPVGRKGNLISISQFLSAISDLQHSSRWPVWTCPRERRGYSWKFSRLAVPSGRRAHIVYPLSQLFMSLFFSSEMSRIFSFLHIFLDWITYQHLPGN